jgi:2,3-bisphosphoglycerate-dependent phosphoglycerate mutase
MLRSFCFITMVFSFSCKTTSYYIVRHAEKETATMASDVALSAEGRQRAEALKDVLQGKNIQAIYSTNYIRTKSTAQPLAGLKNISIQIYDPKDAAFASRVKNVNAGNVLIVGHSNTVDDLANQFMGTVVVAGDLPETQYGDLFIVKKKGKKYRFAKEHFGK